MEQIFSPKVYYLLKVLHRSYGIDLSSENRLKISSLVAEFLYSASIPIQQSALELLTHFDRKYDGNRDDIDFIRTILETIENLDLVTELYMHNLPELIDENSVLQTGVEYSQFAERPIKQCGLLYAIISNSISGFKLLEITQLNTFLKNIRKYQANSNHNIEGRELSLKSIMLSSPSIQDLQSDISYFNDLHLKIDTNPEALSIINSTRTNNSNLYYSELLTARKHFENSDLLTADQRKISNYFY